MTCARKGTYVFSSDGELSIRTYLFGSLICTPVLSGHQPPLEDIVFGPGVLYQCGVGDFPPSTEYTPQPRETDYTEAIGRATIPHFSGSANYTVSHN